MTCIGEQQQVIINKLKRKLQDSDSEEKKEIELQMFCVSALSAKKWKQKVKYRYDIIEYLQTDIAKIFESKYGHDSFWYNLNIILEHNANLYVCYNNGRLVAYAVVNEWRDVPEFNDIGHDITIIETCKPFRGRGIGRRFVHFIEQDITTKRKCNVAPPPWSSGLCHLYVTNPLEESIGFWKKMGYEETDFSRGNPNAMTKSIALLQVFGRD